MAAPILEERMKNILKQAVETVIKPWGFRKRRLRYVRQLPELSWVIGVERGRWDSFEARTFILHFGIFVPGFVSKISRWEAEPRFPSIVHCVVEWSDRDVDLTPPQERWWELRLDDKAEMVDERIIHTIRDYIEGYVLPFFQRFQTVSDVIHFLEDLERRGKEVHIRLCIFPTPGLLPAFLGILYYLTGDTERGLAALERTDRMAYRSKYGETFEAFRARVFPSVADAVPRERAELLARQEEGEEALPASQVRSLLKERLNSLLKQAVDPFLQEAGFRKRGRTYRKPLPELSAMLQVVCNWYDEEASCDFTLFYGIYVPQILSIWDPDRAEPPLPDIDHCVVWAGAGNLNPNLPQFPVGQKWWELRLKTSSEEEQVIRQEVQEEIEGWVLPFLNRFQSRKEVIAYLEWLETEGKQHPQRHRIHPSDPARVLGILSYLEGDRDRCCEALERAYRIAVAEGYFSSYIEALEDLYARLCGKRFESAGLV